MEFIETESLEWNHLDKIVELIWTKLFGLSNLDSALLALCQ